MPWWYMSKYYPSIAWRDREKSRRTSIRITNIERLGKITKNLVRIADIEGLGKITKNLGQDCRHRETRKNHEAPRSGLPTWRDWEKSRRTLVRIANIERPGKITKNLGQDCQHSVSGLSANFPTRGLEICYTSPLPSVLYYDSN